MKIERIPGLGKLNLIGTKISVYDFYEKEEMSGIIVGVALDTPVDRNRLTWNLTVEVPDNELPSGLNYIKLSSSQYKRCYNPYYSTGLSWAFPNADRYRKHLERLWHPYLFKRDKKADEIKYKDFKHDNNDKQVEKRLKAQRIFVTSALESNVVYYRYFTGSEAVVALANPTFEFNSVNKCYYLHTPHGSFNGKKFGKAVSLTPPAKSTYSRIDNFDMLKFNSRYL